METRNINNKVIRGCRNREIMLSRSPGKFGVHGMVSQPTSLSKELEIIDPVDEQNAGSGICTASNMGRKRVDENQRCCQGDDLRIQ
jgi:hypothetical protein